MYGLPDRIQKAAADISEALSVGAPAMPPAGPPLPRPSHMPPPGVPGAPPGMTPQMARPSPLQMMSDFRSAPLQAALQGPRGQESLQKPVGFARGGLAVFNG